MSFRDENRTPTPRQQRVIELVAAGLTNRDKVGLNNRLEPALWYETRLYEGKLPCRRG
jgi:hypothetical protein